MKRLLVLVLALVMVFGAFGGALATSAVGTKIAYVTGTGGLGDKSFNDLGHKGIQALIASGVPCDVAEPTSIAEMEGILRNFADTGEYALIVGMGGDMVDSISKVAADYPEQGFMLIDGLCGVENIKSVVISQEDCAFLVGAYVGLMEKEGGLPNSQGKNTIGIVGGMDIPIIRGIMAAYECGAKYVNPDVTVLKSFVGAWNDPGTGSELTKDMYNKGASIVFQAAGGSGMGVLEAAKNSSLYAIGYDGNQNTIAPDNILASGVRGIDAIVMETAQAALKGEFNGGDTQIAMKENASAAQLTMDDSNVTTPESVLQKLEQIKAFLVEAKVVIPSEPEEVEAYLAQVGSFE